jgi:hypothetical protein
MGGPSRNEATRKLLVKCSERLGVKQEHGHPTISGDRISLRMPDSSWRSFGGLQIDGSLQQVKKDYALILRVANPWSSERGRCLVFSGVHTYGTAAAAQYFVQQQWKPKWWTRQEVMCLLEIEFDEGCVTGINEIEFRRIKRT